MPAAAHAFKNPTVSLFGKSAEAVSLTLPVIFLLAAVPEILKLESFDQTQKGWSMLLGDLVFLNTIHVVFTFQMLMTVPVYRRLLTTPGWAGHWRVLLALFGVAACAIWLKSSSLQSLSLAAILLTTAYTFPHNLRQSLGISLLYNHKAHPADVDSVERHRIEWLGGVEKIFVNCMAAFIVINFSVMTLLKDRVPSWWFSFYAAAAATCAVVVTWLAFKYAFDFNGKLRGKALHIFRYLLLLAAFYSHVAVVGVAAVHGIEYYLIAKKIRTNSGVQSRLHWTLAFTFLAIVLIAARILGDQVTESLAIIGSGRSSTWILALTVFQGSATLVHFYCDAKMFRMKDPRIRNEVGPLLL